MAKGKEAPALRPGPCATAPVEAAAPGGTSSNGEGR